MSLRTKAILAACIALLSTIAALYFIARFVLITGLSRIETYETQKSIQKVNNILAETISRKEAYMVDWAVWDDTYEFIEKGNQQYIERNLGDSTFINFDLNLMLFINSSGNLVYAQAFDLENGEQTEVPPQFLDDTARSRILNPLLAEKKTISGIIMLDEGPLIVAGGPILRSDYTGSVRGTLIFGRFLDGRELNRLGQLTLSDATISRLDQTLESDFQLALRQLSQNSLFVQMLTPQTAAGYKMINDIQGDPAFILKITERRDINMLGQNMVAYFIITILITGIISLVIAALIIDRHIINRFDALRSVMGRIIDTGDATVRMPVSGNDELALMAKTMNLLLTSVEDSSKELKAREEKYRVLAEDVQKLYEQEKQLKEKLQVEIDKRIEYTRGLVHELKTPITPILAASELLLEELREAPLNNLVKSINRSAENLNRRIDELLDLARSEVSSLSVCLEPTDISTLLREVVSEMTLVAHGNRHSLTAEIPKSLPLVEADMDRIRQVLLNLLNNAFKYTPPGGKISLHVKQDVRDLIISVCDNGHGITEAQQRYLFEPYRRMADNKPKLSGLGLGLYLSKSLVELHGGRIWVESKQGEGSIFRFSLPLAAGEYITQEHAQ